MEDHDLKSLQAFMEARFNAIDRRLDDANEAKERMHAENRAEVREVRAENQTEFRAIRAEQAEIKVQVTRTNGRLVTAEGQIKKLFDHCASLFQRVATLRAKARMDESDAHRRDGADEKADPDDQPYGKREVMIFAAGGGAIVAAWKFIEFAIHAVKATP